MFKVDDKIKVIIFFNLGNLIGVIYIKEEFNILVEIVKEKDLWIIVDEVYREFVYDGFEYISCGNLEGV